MIMPEAWCSPSGLSLPEHLVDIPERGWGA